MKLRFLSKVAAYLVLFLGPAAHADWLWENDLAVAKLTPKGYEASFTFHNTGKNTITVTDVDFACPCTVFHFKATSAKPGETGTLTIVVEIDKPGLDVDLEAMVSGPPSVKTAELTVRLRNSESEK